MCYGLFARLRVQHGLNVPESRVLRKIFGPKGDEVTGEWRRLHSKEVRYLYISPNIIPVIKGRRRWTEHVARMGRGEVYTGFWRGDLRERDHLKDLGTVRMIILKWMFKK